MALLALGAPTNFLSAVAGVTEPAAETALTGFTGFTFLNTPGGLVVVRIVVGAAGAGTYIPVLATGVNDATVNLANSTIYRLGPYDPALYSANNGLVTVNLSVVTGNSVGVYKLPQNTGFNRFHSAFPSAPGSTDS